VMLRFPLEDAVLGLINGYGTVALHGEEGFRAELASLACIFTDSVGLPELDVHTRLLQRPLTRVLPTTLRQTLRSRGLRGMGKYYGVPCVSLESALSLGLLQEFGVRPQAIAELKQWVRDRRMPDDRRTPPTGLMPPRPPAPLAVPTRVPLRLRAA
jgi:hypothetical protein